MNGKTVKGGVVNKQRLVDLQVFTAMLLCLLLVACGSSPWRYSPALPEKPGGLAVTGGDGQVALSWAPAGNAAAYNVYYGTSPGLTAATATKISTITSSSTIVTGLTNTTTYYFAVSALNSTGESLLSNEVSATPLLQSPFQQADLQGSWYFNGLVSGTDAGWLRGIAAIDGAGKVTVASYLDSNGTTTAPADLFTVMTIQADGTVSQSPPGSVFHGILSANQYRDLLVGTGSIGSGAPMMILLQKRVAGIAFTSSDIRGTGKLVAGPLPFVYHQLASGISREWEFAVGQIGQDQAVTYSSLSAPTPRQLPGGGNKSVSLAITGDGIVSETPLSGALPQPAALLQWGVMSADKMTVVGTATDVNGAFILRIMQFIHPPSIALTPSSYTLTDLVGSYRGSTLVSSLAPLWIRSAMAIDAASTAVVTSYLDSSGSAALPGPLALSMNQEGLVTNSADPSYHGKLSYLKDLLVTTRTEAAGVYRLGIDLRR
jgi:hypothetical protein